MGIIGDISLEILKLINRITLKPSREIKKVVKIYDEMHKILEGTEAQRMLILKAHNGGGLIKTSTPLYVSVLYEDYRMPFKTVKEQYQKIQLDGEYLRMLSVLCEQKVVKIKKNSLKPSLLKDIYTAEGVEYAEIHYLGQDRKNLYYCSVASAWENGWQGKTDQELIVKLAINTIRNNIV